MPSPESVSMKLSRIVLLGFMGAGKSTVGAMLAARMGWAFYDSDSLLEERTNLSVAELFALHGEEGFRAREAETVAELLQGQEAVIALGGGAIENASTRSLLIASEDTRTIFLDAPLQTMLERCQVSGGIRPLLEDREGIPIRYESRLPHYQSADITVDTGELTAEVVVDLLIQRLQEPSLKAIPSETVKGRSL